MVEIRNQRFVIARLADYCDYRQALRGDIQDPILYMWEKLKEIDAPMRALKQEILEEACAQFFWDVVDKKATEAALADFKHLLEGYLSAGDFADAMFHLDLKALADIERLKFAADLFKGLKAQRLLDEEDKPPERRSANWTRLVGDIYRRMQFDILEQVRKRKPLSAHRLHFLLRRCRYNTADYCAVFHLPLHAGDTFTPFIIPRVEALIAANMRFLKNLRAG